MRIGVVAATASGRGAAETLRAAWPGEVRLVAGNKVADALREACLDAQSPVFSLSGRVR